MFKIKVFKDMEQKKLNCQCVGYPLFFRYTSDDDFSYLNLVANQIAQKYPADESCQLVLTFTGSSGAIACGYVLSILYNTYEHNAIRLCNIRKPEDVTHHSSDAIFFKNSDKIIVIDDFIATGNTLEYLITQIAKVSPDKKINDVFSSADLRFVPEERLSIFKEKIETIWIGD